MSKSLSCTSTIQYELGKMMEKNITLLTIYLCFYFDYGIYVHDFREKSVKVEYLYMIHHSMIFEINNFSVYTVRCKKESSESALSVDTGKITTMRI